jgi:hypothetical protein
MSATLESRQNYAEFDEFIDYQIQKTRQGVKLTDVVTAACGVALLTISYLLVFVVLDHWVISGGFGYGMRLALLSGLLVASLGLIGWKVALPWFRTVTRLYAAKSLEGISPDLQSNLLNYVDLRDSGRDVSPAIIRSIEKRAAVTLSHTDVDDAFDRRPMLRLSYGLLAAVVVFSMYTVFSPKKVWPSVARVLAPWAELSVSTQTEFLSIDPGQDVKVIAGENLEVSVDLRGEIPAEVNLYFTTDDRRFVNERVNLAATEEGLKQFRCILNGENSAGLLQSLSYRIEAGDARTQTFRVIVSQPPSARVSALHYDYPDYMELPNESPQGADIHAWEGTRIAIEAETNLPVTKAWVHFSDEEQFPANPEPLRMTIDEPDGRRLSVVWQPIHREDRSFPSYYRIQCETDEGIRNPAPAIHSIQIDVDKKPDLVAVSPSRNLDVPANAIVPFLARASDPDFRLSDVTLRLQHGKQALQREIYSGTDDRTKSIYDLKLEDFNLRPGDQIEWWLEARDNRRVEGPDRRDASRMRVILDSNLSTTPRLKLTILAPVDEQEAQEQHQFDRDQLEEKLDERDQTPNEPAPDGDPSDARDPDNRNFDPEDAPRKSDPNEAPAGDENSKEPEDGTQKATGESGDTNEGEGKSSEGTTKGGEGTDGSETGAKSGEDGNTGNAESGEGSGETSEQGPLSNTGEDDQEVLRELLNREAKRQEAQDENGNTDASDPSDPSNDTGSDDGTQNNNSPNPGSNPDENTEPRAGGSSNDTNDSQENNPEGVRNTDNRPSNPDNNDPATPDSGEEGSKLNPTNEDVNSADTPNAQPKSDMPGGDPSNDSTNPQSNSDTPGEGPSTPSEATPPTDSENPSQNSDPESANNPGESETAKPGENPDSPNSENASDDSSNPQSNPSGEGQNNNPNSGQKQNPSGNPSANPQSKPGSSGKPGESSNNPPSQPGKSGEGGSGDEGGKSGSSPSETGSKSGKPGSGESGEKSGTGDSASPSGKKPEGDSGAANSPSESGSEDGGPASSKESSEKPDQGNPGGDDTTGNGTPSKSESSGKTGSQSSEGSKSGSNSGGKSAGGKSGKGGAKGSSGQSFSSGGKAGKGGGNAQGGGNPTEGGQTGPASKTGGDRILREPNELDGHDAVQGPNAGGSVSDPNTPPAEDGNLEDKLKATNMVLKRLKEDMKRGEVDDELLKKLGWTEQDMKRFSERLERKLEQPKSDDPRELARQRQFEESLKSLDLKKSGGQRSDPVRDKRATNNFSDRRMPVPLEYRRAFEDYTKRLARQQKGRSTSSDK